MINAYVYRVPLPRGINEMVTPNIEDEGFTIYIDENLTYEQSLRAYEHALRHITNNDFEKFDVDEIETQCHN